ncbi:hypothetical protein FA15DRAFT_662749 [Coprinopsis marcescibilis]|uniref:MFS general substrate transporter n=1 Tax=Coprinopsis marcescibilis TaxID=230819 RepID=A0A5C3LD05_COPMA|nr:hypothetical protein FA15DRAFT_662749 [Coprinopsis marcescibilis]
MPPRPKSAGPMAVSSSLNSVFISPRTPKTPRNAAERYDEDDVELELLADHEREQAHRDLSEDQEDEAAKPETVPKKISAKDKRNMVLLCVLYLIQGVPLGLALGSVPFLLKEHLSYSQLATFALSSYPYSLKLLWSPIVDSVYFRRIGRRKSWIIPMQLIVGSLMLYISLNVQKLMKDPANHVGELTAIFTLLVSFSATQDIAVDGWALTLLSQDCLSYASTCQTIGLNTGFFASFTVFLAFNSEAFAHKWGLPVLTISAYLRFWAVICYLVTIWLLFFKKEDKEVESEEMDMSIGNVYKTIWTICKLRHVQLLIVIHLFAKIGFVAHEATSLKLVEKGLKREDLAVAVLIDFPFQILGGWFSAKWSRGDKPLRPWLYAFWPRFLFGVVSVFTVYFFPKPPISTGFFIFLIGHTILSSFTSTVQFVGISAFHTRVSDPLIGGTYMTLLNTFTNMGGTWPKWFILNGVDWFSIANCHLPKTSSQVLIKATECISHAGKAHCKAVKGDCVYERDGYYIVTTACMIFGMVFLVAAIYPAARKLQGLPTSAWRLKSM